MFRALSSLALIVAGSVAAAPALFADATEQAFQIKRAPIAKALNNLAKQAGISIARPRLSYRDGKARAVNGSFTLEEALTRLLHGTDYSFQVLSPNSVRIFKTPPVVASFPEKRPRIVNPIEEILVTTTRRLDAVQKLPYSISAVTGTRQENLRAVTSSDIIHRVSSIYATKRGEGQNKIIIRGLSDGAFAGRAQSLVSTYFDNTRVTYNAPDPSLRLYDIETVEVLRGPQGTLYGSGALGGLYRVVTRKARFG